MFLPGQLIRFKKSRDENIYLLIEKCIPPEERFNSKWASKFIWWKLLSSAGTFEYCIEETFDQFEVVKHE